jgi:hypothetical protein
VPRVGYDMNMVEPPTAAEVRKTNLDASNPGYFRYNISAMPIMVMTMMWAGVVVDDESEPEFPDIPDSLSEARKDAMSKALRQPSLDAKLPAADREIVVKYRAILHVHSKHAGKVPAYKFQVNDGFVVAPDECKAIVTALRAYKPDATKLANLKKIWHDARATLNAQVGSVGGGKPVLNDELQLSLDDWKQWIAEWTTYNEIAARHGGYTID